MWKSLLLVTASLSGGFTEKMALQSQLHTLSLESEGRVGICALEASTIEPVCVNGDQAFPLQSVMKVVVAAVVMDQVDQGKMKLTDTVVLHPKDASPGPQDLADLIKKKGSLTVTIEELVRRSIVESDSTSVDFLIKKIGIKSVQDFLKAKNIAGLRIDRDERGVQSESMGLAFNDSFADDRKFEAAIKAVSADLRSKAARNYLRDPRDTSTPIAMVQFLKALASGQLVSAPSTQKLLSIMEATETGKDRLIAGIPKDWRLGHKTGTGRTWKGNTSATNDVGVLTAPSGEKVFVAIFIAGSGQDNAKRASIIATAARYITSGFVSKPVN